MMLKLKWLFVFIGCIPGIFSCEAKFVPTHRVIEHQLGEDIVKISLYQFGNDDKLVFINLHADETTSVEAAKSILETEEGLLIIVENNNKRNINFRLQSDSYSFDPNRIFSGLGIQRTLERFGSNSDAAAGVVKSFADKILSLIPEQPRCIIALHNNTDGGLAIHSFMKGAMYEKDAKAYYANETEDPDDFFLTTDSVLFHQLAKSAYNVVWQDNLRVDQDGSLSVYCGEQNIRYLNCETQHGKTKQHALMLREALRAIARHDSRPAED